MTIYNKPTRALLKGMLAEWNLTPGRDVLGEARSRLVREELSEAQGRSIHAHLVQASTNDPSRRHHPATNATDDLLFKVAAREYRCYEPGVDPAPIRAEFAYRSRRRDTDLVAGNILLYTELSALAAASPR